MKFENPDIKEGINISKEHPLKEFFQLSVAILVITAIVIFVINIFAGYFAGKIPFSYEKKMVQHIDLLKVKPSPQQQQLQALADRLILHMNLPEDMTITVHYSKKNMVNAMATMGGNVYFFKGLIDKLKSENALAMVMAHEIAHVKHRDPIVATGKGLTLAVLMSSFVGASSSTAGEKLIGESLNIGLMKFSRDQETESDLAAADAIQKEYGNILGAKELFEVFAELSAGKPNSEKQGFGKEGPEIFSSHPPTKDRWLTLKKLENENGWVTEGKLIPLDFVTP